MQISSCFNWYLSWWRESNRTHQHLVHVLPSQAPFSYVPDIVCAILLRPHFCKTKLSCTFSIVRFSFNLTSWCMTFSDSATSISITLTYKDEILCCRELSTQEIDSQHAMLTCERYSSSLVQIPWQLRNQALYKSVNIVLTWSFVTL